MTFGTPVVGANAASAGPTFSVAYPASVGAADQLVLICVQKPSSVSGGTFTAPAGWTTQVSHKDKGGYGVTTGADVGNMNIYIATCDTLAAGGETGSVSCGVGATNSAQCHMIRIPTGGGAISFATTTGEQTAGGNVSAALDSGPGIASGDMLIWAMAIPTDVTTPSQFSAHSISATGATFASPVELAEFDSTLGNDLGGYSARALCSAGPSSAAPTIGATAGGTTTNVRGPFALLRMREGSGVPSASPDNSAYAHSSTSPSLAAKSSITPTASTHAHGSSSPSLAAKSAVAPDASTYGYSSSSPTLAAKSSVAPDGSAYAHSSSSPTIGTPAASVNPAGSTYSHTSTDPSLAARSAIPPDTSAYGHVSTSPTIAAKSALAPDNSVHAHGSSLPSLAARSAVIPDASLYAHGSTLPTIAARSSLTPDGSSHAHSSTSPSLLARAALTPSDSLYVHVSTSPSLTPHAPGNGIYVGALAPDGLFVGSLTAADYYVGAGSLF